MCCIGYVEDGLNHHRLFADSSSMSYAAAREIVCFHDILVRNGGVGLGVKQKYFMPC